MLVAIDNFDGAGARDYTGALSTPVRTSTASSGNLAAQAGYQQSRSIPDHVGRVERRLNSPARLSLTLAAESDRFVVPSAGARVVVQRNDGSKLFTGYVAAEPEAVYAGCGTTGLVYRYLLTALSDEFVLDRKTLPARAPFVGRAAGAILKELAQELVPGGFDTSAVADCDIIPWFASNPEKRWSEHAAELGLWARASYRAHDGSLRFQAAGASEYAVDETAETFSPDGLKLSVPANLKPTRTGGPPGPQLMNDVAVLGKSEPWAYVKDYFLGDGFKLGFGLSNQPFTRFSTIGWASLSCFSYRLLKIKPVSNTRRCLIVSFRPVSLLTRGWIETRRML